MGSVRNEKYRLGFRLADGYTKLFTPSILERIFEWKLKRDDELEETGKNDKITIRYMNRH